MEKKGKKYKIVKREIPEFDLSPDIEKLQKQWDKDPKSKVFLELAEKYRKSNMTEEAVFVLESGLEHHPNFYVAKIALAKAYLEISEKMKAKQVIDEMLEKTPNNVMALRIAGDIAWNEGDFNEAKDLYTRIININPMDPKAKERLGELDKGVPEEKIELAEMDDDAEMEIERTASQEPVTPEQADLSNMPAEAPPAEEGPGTFDPGFQPPEAPEQQEFSAQQPVNPVEPVQVEPAQQDFQVNQQPIDIQPEITPQAPQPDYYQTAPGAPSPVPQVEIEQNGQQVQDPVQPVDVSPVEVPQVEIDTGSQPAIEVENYGQVEQPGIPESPIGQQPAAPEIDNTFQGEQAPVTPEAPAPDIAPVTVSGEVGNVQHTPQDNNFQQDNGGGFYTGPPTDVVIEPQQEAPASFDAGQQIQPPQAEYEFAPEQAPPVEYDNVEPVPMAPQQTAQETPSIRDMPGQGLTPEPIEVQQEYEVQQPGEAIESPQAPAVQPPTPEHQNIGQPDVHIQAPVPSPQPEAQRPQEINVPQPGQGFQQPQGVNAPQPGLQPEPAQDMQPPQAPGMPQQIEVSPQGQDFQPPQEVNVSPQAPGTPQQIDVSPPGLGQPGVQQPQAVQPPPPPRPGQTPPQPPTRQPSPNEVTTQEADKVSEPASPQQVFTGGHVPPSEAVPPPPVPGAPEQPQGSSNEIATQKMKPVSADIPPPPGMESPGQLNIRDVGGVAASHQAPAPPGSEENILLSGSKGSGDYDKELADFYVKQGHFDKAAEVYRKLSTMDPTNEMLRQKIGEMEQLAKGQGKDGKTKEKSGVKKWFKRSSDKNE